MEGVGTGTMEGVGTWVVEGVGNWVVEGVGMETGTVEVMLAVAHREVAVGLGAGEGMEEGVVQDWL